MPEDAADVVDPHLKAAHLVIDPHVVGLATERTSPGRHRFALERLRKSPVLYLSKHIKRIEKVSKFILLHLDAHHQWEPAMATKLDERSTELAQQLATLLGRFLDGKATVEELLDFEAPLAFDRTLNADLRHDLGGIALFAEEIERNMRPITDLRGLAFKLRTVIPRLDSRIARNDLPIETQQATAVVGKTIQLRASTSSAHTKQSITLTTTAAV